MDIVKKNILSILCGVVALAGVIAWFWPIGPMYDELQKKVEESASTYDQVDSLPKASRNKPTLVVATEAAGPEPLGRFPNDKTIEVGRAATEAMAEQSKKMLGTVTDMNVHELLTPGSLPEPELQARQDFTFQYQDVLGNGEKGWQEGVPKKLSATIPPTREQLEAKAAKVWAEKFAIQVLEVGGTNNLKQIEDRFLAEIKGLPDQERRRVAQSHMVYLQEDALPIHPEIIPGVNCTAEQIWYAQTALWITEDVAEAIVSANTNSKTPDGGPVTNVTEAPIKHLIALRIPFTVEQFVTAGGKAGEDGAAAAFPVDANGAPAVWSASPTGRVCNDLYDVIHFDLVLRADATRVPQVLAELERNQLITVLQCTVHAVDAAAERKTNGFVYGNQPIVQLELKCEALFLRKWTIDKENEGKNALMPDLVQEAIGAKPKAAAAAEGA